MAAEVQRGEESQGIKLFGATIRILDGGDAKKGGEDEDQRAEKRAEKIIACPRCKSMETKFCYFNNYNVNQPRHFCKGCQRYWTAGGALRNVPVGAGRRKAKPPFRGDGSSSANYCLYETSSSSDDDVRKFGLDEWHAAAAARRDFRQLFPDKRRRTASGG